MNLVYIALYYACPERRRRIVLARIVSGVVAVMLLLHILGKIFPDDNEQITAYWTGWSLETPFAWILLWYLYTRDDTRGQSLELW